MSQDGQLAAQPLGLTVRFARLRMPQERTLVVAALTAATAAVWITLRAKFLAHPGWLAVQKADVILGPVLVGLYWLRRRPKSRFGPLLVGVGFVNAVYIVQSSSIPLLYSAGVLWEGAVSLATMALILTFPTGRLDGRAARWILAAEAFVVVVPHTLAVLTSPHLTPDGSISGCAGACPRNVFFVAGDGSSATQLVDLTHISLVAVSSAAILLLVSRMRKGTPPQRRAFAIGAPIAIFFLITRIGYQGLTLAGLGHGGLADAMRWSIAGSRAAIWYGFLLSLVAAELFAAGVLRRIVEVALRRPALGKLEDMLRGPLGDPELRLAFQRPGKRGWTDVDGTALEPAGPSSERALTEVEQDGRPAAAIIHDARLGDDPELLKAAGAVALLALENAELSAAWDDSLSELRDSRARLVAVGDAERRKLERDLHDGAQQRLVALRVRLGMTSELVNGNPEVRAALSALEGQVDEAIDELRELAHGIYPSLLVERGLAAALRTVATPAGGSPEVSGAEMRRYPIEIESAIYYSCVEAVQNATKHAGADAHISIRLKERRAAVGFEVRDDGLGFDIFAPSEGAGLHNIEARLEAVGGHVEVTSARNRGTVVSGQVPLT